MPTRKKIPGDLIADVTSACRRRCCFCFVLDNDDKEKRGQIAHLDHDPSNNARDNLAFLCLHHHDDYDSPRSQSKGLTIIEAKRYRAELLANVAQHLPSSDEQIIGELLRALDRPAFRTPFHYESSLERFREAIAETIDTFNTGHSRGRQISSKYQIRDLELRAKVDGMVVDLVSLRAAFDRLLRGGQIRQCCSDPKCSVYFIDGPAAHEMDERRRKILQSAHSLDPAGPHVLYDLD
jgi:hypothetical protein